MEQSTEEELQKFELNGQTRLQGPILTMRISDVVYVLTVKPPFEKRESFKIEKIVPISEVTSIQAGYLPENNKKPHLLKYTVSIGVLEQTDPFPSVYSFFRYS